MNIGSFVSVVTGVTHAQETYQNTAALFGADSRYQNLLNTADQSNHTILVTCIGERFWYKFPERVSSIYVVDETKTMASSRYLTKLFVATKR